MSSVAKGDRSDSYGPRAVVLRPRRLFFSLFQTGGGILVPAVLCCRSRSIEVVRIVLALMPWALWLIDYRNVDGLILQHA